jgi:hypothetical protein
VEELFDPSLKGEAVVVGGLRDERGLVYHLHQRKYWCKKARQREPLACSIRQLLDYWQTAPAPVVNVPLSEYHPLTPIDGDIR